MLGSKPSLAVGIMTEGLFWSEAPPPSGRKTGEPVQLNKIRSAHSDWRFAGTFPELTGPVAIDLETKDPELKIRGPGWPFGPGHGYPVGVAVSWAGGTAYYPTAHEGGDNAEDPDQVWRWLAAQVAKPDVTMIAANAAYDQGWMSTMGAVPHNDPIDIQSMAALLDENRLAYSLDSLGLDEFGVGKDTELLDLAAAEAGLARVKDSLWRLPARFVGPYAERDADLTLRLYHCFKDRLELENLMRAFDVERRVMAVAFRMRQAGVRVDVDQAERVSERLKAKEEEQIAYIKSLSGVTVDAWGTDSVARALETEGVVAPRTSKGNVSVTREWLASIKTPIATAMLAVRRYNKARTTFVDGHVLHHAVNGRVHAEFHALRREDSDGSGYGTVTGRFSVSNPGLQQIPARDEEICTLVRSLFLPETGERWASADYASQEPRLIVHFAAKAECRGAAETVEAYQRDPKTDFHAWVARLAGITRSEAKTINLGLGYGMGGATLCHHLGLPTEYTKIRGVMWEVAGEAGQRLFNLYHEKVPFVKALTDMVSAAADTRGYVVTLNGRRCRFPERNGFRAFTHKALNRLIQGSAADQLKRAMVAVYESEGWVPLVTVHDELGFSVSNDRQADRITEIMENAVRLEVPVVADTKVVNNWGEAKVDPDRMARWVEKEAA